MADVIYVVEDEYTGNYTGFWSKDAAIKHVAQIYIENGFGGLYDTICIDVENGNHKDCVITSLEQIKEDLTNLFESGYIDSLAYIHEVEIGN